MNYIRTEADGQLVFDETTEFLMIPSMLHGFHNTSTETASSVSRRNVYVFHGDVEMPEEEADAVAELLSKEMQAAAELSVPLPAEAKSGRSWYDAK